MKGNIFIKRPAMAISISIVILILGFISLATLPVERFPDIAPPTVYVSASYTGADADAVQKAVIMPLEEGINGVENMIYMTSTATNSGSASLAIYFKQGTNPDMAAVNVQNRVSRTLGLLPAEVTRIGVSVQKRQTSFLQIDGMTCTNGRYDETFIANYLDINVYPQLKRIEGVGDVMAYSDNYSMRIWLKPDVMAQYRLIPADITAVLGEQNIVAPTGALGENSGSTFQFTMKYKGRLTDVEQFKNMVVRSEADGNVLKLKDVADVELGSLSYSFRGSIDGQPGVNFMVYPIAGVNATEVNQQVTAMLHEMEKDLPEGLEFVKLMNTNDFLFASIDRVVETLIIAILLVILVVYFFLQDFKSTFIPSVSIIVSLVGTFTCLQIAGFSINILTLFALVLVIGTVVDDAIVVVEAVQAKFDSGYRSSYKATKDAMGDVSMAIISCTLVFMVVFIPVTFMGGTSGIFYTQFGITMATSVGISLISAMTLCPALCAMIMRPADGTKSVRSINGRVRAAYNASFNAVLDKYRNGVMFFIRRRHRWMVYCALVGAVVLLVFLMSTTKTGLVPQEDQGTMSVNISTSPGSSLNETTKIIDKVEALIREVPEVEHYARTDGYGMLAGQGTSYGLIMVRLKDWSERPGKEHSIEAVMARLNRQFATIKEAQIFAYQSGMIPGYGTGNAIELHLQDRTGGDMRRFYDASTVFLEELNKRPEITQAQSSYTMNFPQYQVDVDAAQCKRAGISPAEVLNVLGNYYGGSYASNFNQYGKVYRVIVQANPNYRLNEESLRNVYVRIGTAMSPISQFLKLQKINGAETATRFNLFSSISANVNIAEGYSSGQAMAAIAEVAAASLPTGYGYEYAGIAREESQSGGSSTVFIYALCVVLIYFILVCLYESFFVPFAVIFSVPFGLMGSFLFARLFGLENNIYLQTGVIMLIGLLAKTAILITEYASERRRQGMGIVASAYSAAMIRLRPILMTVLAMIFGMLPLMFATGAGARGNNALSTGVVGGMLIGTLSLLFVVPVFFIIFQWMQERFVRKPVSDEDDNDSNPRGSHLSLPTVAKSLTILIIVGSALSSCGVYSKYHRPADIPTDSIFGAAYIPADTSNLGQTHWRDIFTDANLQFLISQGLQNNLDIQVAHLRVEQAEAALMSSRLAFLPSVAFSPQGAVSRFDGTTTKTYNIPLSASWQVDIFGRLRNAKERSKAMLESSRAYRQAVQTQLVATIATCYYQLLLLDEQLRVSEATAEIWSQNVATMRRLMDAGIYNDAAVSRSEASHNRVQASVLELKQQILEAENRLSVLLGEPLHHIERGAITEWQTPASISVGVPLSLLSQRPDVQAAEHNLAAAFYATNEARSAFYPSITLSGSAGWTNSLGNVANPGKLLLDAVGSLMQPIFQNGRLKAQLRISHAAQEEARLTFRQTLLDAGMEANNALTQAQTCAIKSAFYAGQVASLTRAVKSTRLLMDYGSSTYLEVLTAQEELLSAQLTQITNQYDEINAVIALYQALGGGADE